MKSKDFAEILTGIESHIEDSNPTVQRATQLAVSVLIARILIAMLENHEKFSEEEKSTHSGN